MKYDSPLRVLLLLQRPEAWVNLASLWSALADPEMFRPEIWILPYQIDNPILSNEKAGLMRALLGQAGIPFHEWSAGQVLSKGQFDVVVLNHPYDRDRPRDFWFDQLQRLVPVTVYIPYGLVMAGGIKNLKLQFSQPTQINATAVVARSELERGLYRSNCPSGDGHVHVVGLPRFDYMLQALARPIPEWMSSAIGGRTAVLWNSHFSFGMSCSHGANFSTFDLIGPELLELMLERRERLCLIWRPHPGLFPAILRENLLDSADLLELRQELQRLGIVLDETADHAAAFSASAALLTDVGSFLLEYLITGKPVLALINRDGEPFNEESAKLVKHYASASTPAEVERFIDQLEDGSVDVAAVSRAQAEHLPMLDGQAGRRVAGLIQKLCGRSVKASAPQESQCHVNVPSSRVENMRAVGVEERGAPVLTKLLAGLRAVRAEKAKQSVFAKRLRRRVNASRTVISELVKGFPLLMDLAGRLRGLK
ncbi:hypothetical protein [Stenotrophomonas sp.]|uniref:hypothetical protein n=1 Tax=Stenotrophomonas sp. TaxID=69392 RepID=UPI0028AF5C53|nr:hypothetical protein [Stenotrophomonas sp.]